MMKRINDLSIRMKFAILYLLGVMLPIVVLLVYVLTSVTASIREREMQNAMQSLDRVHSTFDAQFNSAFTLANAVTVDAHLLTLMREEYQYPWKFYYAYFTDLRPQLTRYLSAFSQNVSNIELYSSNTTVFSGGFCLSLASAEAEPWMPEDISVPSVRMVSYIKRTPSNTNVMQISLVRTLADGLHAPIVIKIDLYTEPFHRIIAGETDYLDIYLLSPEGFAVSYPGIMEMLSPIKSTVELPDVNRLSMDFLGKSYLTGWRLEAVVNEAPIRVNIRNAVYNGVLLGVSCSLLAGALCLLMSRSVVTRSKRLLRHMDSMTNEYFDVVSRDIGHDEIGELIEHFNAMSARMKQLIHDVYVLELHNKNYELESVRAELKYLQAQIDPHFLFNTLNAILVLCVRNGYTELADVIRALSKILRRMIDTARDTVPLREELQFVEMVLLIERFRFGEKLRYEIDVPDELLSFPVPVMCVQALVENACKHGIQHIDRQGVIVIRASLDGAFMNIDVSDNGAGIPPTRMRSLQRDVRSSDDIEGSVGLQNIYRRLVLQYGEKAELYLDNAPEGGVTATIRIPKGESDA